MPLWVLVSGGPSYSGSLEGGNMPRQRVVNDEFAIYRQSNCTLVDLTRRGDQVAKRLLTERAHVSIFVQRASLLPRPATFTIPVSKDLTLVFRTTGDRRVEMSIECDSHREIKRCWPVIAAWRKHLDQALEAVYPYNRVCEAYCMWRGDNKSATAIAYHFNREAIRMLECYVKRHAALAKSRMTETERLEWEGRLLDQELRYVAYVREHGQTAADRHPLIRQGKGALTDLFADLLVDSMFKELGARADDVKAFCGDVIAQLQAGQSVNACEGYPLNRDQIREKLRFLEKNLLAVTSGSLGFSRTKTCAVHLQTVQTARWAQPDCAELHRLVREEGIEPSNPYGYRILSSSIGPRPHGGIGRDRRQSRSLSDSEVRRKTDHSSSRPMVLSQNRYKKLQKTILFHITHELIDRSRKRVCVLSQKKVYPKKWHQPNPTHTLSTDLIPITFFKGVIDIKVKVRLVNYAVRIARQNAQRPTMYSAPQRWWRAICLVHINVGSEIGWPGSSCYLQVSKLRTEQLHNDLTFPCHGYTTTVLLFMPAISRKIRETQELCLLL